MNTDNREAFAAIIAPIGIDIEQVISVLSQKCLEISYQPNIIKLTDFLRILSRVGMTYDNEVERYRDFINAGDKLCSDAERGDILALLGISYLMKKGPKIRNEEAYTRQFNIIRQIKRLDEYNTLERIYGRNIIFIGCFAPKESRVNYLVDRQKFSDRTSNISKLESRALEIISIDEDESDKEYGQKVIECYPKSDFILDCTSRKTLEESCERMLKIFFGHPFISPTKDEYASYIANAAAYRSLDLSRQVGAAIFGQDGDIISMGCNEVPAPGGGTYWCDGTHDSRDFIMGYDSNQRVKEDLARDALDKLRANGWLNPTSSEIDLTELTRRVFNDWEKAGHKSVGPWKNAMISDIIEYGRMVHAEMNAITDAARFNRSTQGATLYCTTMPCHMCSKLIISAGIQKVVYVQPYVKSLAAELFKDSIVFEGSEIDHRVNYTSLKGVTPAGFKRAFSKGYKRKNPDGTAKSWNKQNAKPTFLSIAPYYLSLEVELLSELRDNPVISSYLGS